MSTTTRLVAVVGFGLAMVLTVLLARCVRLHTAVVEPEPHPLMDLWDRVAEDHLNR